MKLEVYAEECCDYCMEIIHNHIDCPVCKEDYAETDAFFSLSELGDSYTGDTIKCECGAEFKLVSGSAYCGGEWELVEK